MSIITTAYPPEHRKMLAPPRDLSLSVKPSGTERFPSIPKTYGLTVGIIHVSLGCVAAVYCQGTISHYQIGWILQDETALCSMDTVPPIQPPFDGNIPSCHLPPDSNASVSLSTQTRTTYQRLIPTLASLEQRKRFLVKLQGILDSEFPDKRIKAHLFGCAMLLQS